MIFYFLLVVLGCVVFAYIPLTLVFIHSRTKSGPMDKYHHIKRKYWQTDYYGDSDSSIEQLEKEIDELHKR